MGRRIRMMLAGGAVCGLLALAVACDGEETGPATEAVSPERCRPVSAGVLRSVAVGLERGPRRLVHGAMVQSDEDPEVRLIAGRFTADNIPDDQIGVWAKVGPLDGDGPILAVDRIAQAFSRWPPGDAAAGTGLLADGVADARACSRDGGA